VRFNLKTKIFEGLVKEHMTDREGVVEELTEIWVRSNMDEAFLDSLVTRAEKSSRFILIPAGSAMEIGDVPDSITEEDAPVLRFCQGNKNTCVTDSLASALAYKNKLVDAKRIHDIGQEFLDNGSQEAAQPLLTQVMNQLRKNLNTNPKKFITKLHLKISFSQLKISVLLF
jgi:hypothetical protein